VLLGWKHAAPTRLNHRVEHVQNTSRRSLVDVNVDCIFFRLYVDVRFKVVKNAVVGVPMSCTIDEVLRVETHLEIEKKVRAITFVYRMSVYCVSKTDINCKKAELQIYALVANPCSLSIHSSHGRLLCTTL
jgi:hypothetical protein